MTSQTKKSLGDFMEELATKASPASAATLKGIQEKLEAKKQAELEEKLKRIYANIEVNVERIRSSNKSIAASKAAINGFKAIAEKLVSGQELTEAESRSF